MLNEYVLQNRLFIMPSLRKAMEDNGQKKFSQKSQLWLGHVLTPESMESCCPPPKGYLTWAIVFGCHFFISSSQREGVFIVVFLFSFMTAFGYIVSGYIYHLDVESLPWGL